MLAENAFVKTVNVTTGKVVAWMVSWDVFFPAPLASIIPTCRCLGVTVGGTVDVGPVVGGP